MYKIYIIYTSFLETRRAPVPNKRPWKIFFSRQMKRIIRGWNFTDPQGYPRFLIPDATSFFFSRMMKWRASICLRIGGNPSKGNRERNRLKIRHRFATASENDFPEFLAPLVTNLKPHFLLLPFFLSFFLSFFLRGRGWPSFDRQSKRAWRKFHRAQVESRLS